MICFGQVTPYRRVGRVVVLHPRMGGQRMLRGHTLSYKLDVREVARKLPLSPCQSALRVMITGSTTPESIVVHLKSYFIRREKVLGYLRWMKMVGNEHYTNVEIDMQAVDGLPANGYHSDMVSVCDIGAVRGRPVTGGPTVMLQDDNDGLHMTNATLIHGAPDGTTDEINGAELTAAGIVGTQQSSAGKDGRSPPELFLIRTSAEFGEESELAYAELLFPYLYPFGRGGPSEKFRRIRIGRDLLFSHYLRLSTGAFMGFEFALHIYNCMALTKLMDRVRITASYQSNRGFGADAQIGSRYNNLTNEELSAVGKYFASVRAARKNGTADPPKPQNLSARGMAFLKSVRSSCESMQHTSEYAGNARVRSYCMHYRFGKPTWWYVLLLTAGK